VISAMSSRLDAGRHPLVHLNSSPSRIIRVREMALVNDRIPSESKSLPDQFDAVQDGRGRLLEGPEPGLDAGAGTDHAEGPVKAPSDGQERRDRMVRSKSAGELRVLPFVLRFCPMIS